MHTRKGFRNIQIDASQFARSIQRVNSSQRDNQKEVVRLLSLQHGYKKASELANVDYAVVRQWAVRGKWKQNSLSQSVTKPVTIAADNIAAQMKDLKTKTKLSLAKYSAKASRDAENATLRDSPLVHKVAQVASLVWPEEQKAQNILQLGVLIGTTPPEKLADAHDIESECQDSGD